jgi:hypothetical protein
MWTRRNNPLRLFPNRRIESRAGCKRRAGFFVLNYDGQEVQAAGSTPRQAVDPDENQYATQNFNRHAAVRAAHDHRPAQPAD